MAAVHAPLLGVYQNRTVTDSIEPGWFVSGESIYDQSNLLF